MVGAAGKYLSRDANTKDIDKGPLSEHQSRSREAHQMREPHNLIKELLGLSSGLKIHIAYLDYGCQIVSLLQQYHQAQIAYHREELEMRWAEWLTRLILLMPKTPVSGHPSHSTAIDEFQRQNTEYADLVEWCKADGTHSVLQFVRSVEKRPSFAGNRHPILSRA